MPGRTVVVDVREDLRAKREPFGTIMSAVAQLGPEDRMELLAIFEPVPLYTVLARRGFAHSAQRTPEGDWCITFFHDAAAG